MLFLHNEKIIYMRHIAIVFFVVLAFGSCDNSSKENKTLVIFHAGSLSKPIKAIANEYMRENPGVVIQLEAAGSVECARKITELNRQADILASADYKIIDDLLIPKHATWNLLFAGNEMALVYKPESKYASEISRDNWYSIIQKPEVFYGRSDPNADPCGYRTLLTLQLSELYYNSPNLMNSIASKDNRFIRPKEVDLLALIESGAIDYLFIYRSVAVQHGLLYLSLPPEINLSTPIHADFYSNSAVSIRGSSPGDSLVIRGEPMVYGITIPNNAPNMSLAIDFLKYFISNDKGLKVIEDMGMPLVSPIVVRGDSSLFYQMTILGN